MVCDGSKSVEELLIEYKNLINFDDSMEKNNFKFVTQYLKREKKKNPNYEKDNILFLEDVIDIHKRYIKNQNFRV